MGRGGIKFLSHDHYWLAGSDLDNPGRMTFKSYVLPYLSSYLFSWTCHEVVYIRKYNQITTQEITLNNSLVNWPKTFLQTNRIQSTNSNKNLIFIVQMSYIILSDIVNWSNVLHFAKRSCWKSCSLQLNEQNFWEKDYQTVCDSNQCELSSTALAVHIRTCLTNLSVVCLKLSDNKGRHFGQK